MKCAAGIELKHGHHCQKCGARSNEPCPEAYAQQVRYVKTLEDLVQCLIDNDPDEPIADNGMTVLDGWRDRAKRVLVGGPGL